MYSAVYICQSGETAGWWGGVVVVVMHSNFDKKMAVLFLEEIQNGLKVIFRCQLAWIQKFCAQQRVTHRQSGKLPVHALVIGTNVCLSMAGNVVDTKEVFLIDSRKVISP
ncbi:hypothetical protein Pfo_012507 [Paulownia fortunei]|nr:hypothetical protein Pfo_012507 [Paulownia fortunei]